MLVERLLELNVIINREDIQSYSNDEWYPLEIMERRVVDAWFADKLKAYDEVVVDNDYGTWRGRQSTGQAIYLDDVIGKIYIGEVMKWIS